jgi:hypothetical protein
MHPSRILLAWYGLMVAGGFLFGLMAERRPFGNDTLAHPLVVFFATAAAGLLLLRVTLGRRVPELIPERPLIGAACSALPRSWLAISPRRGCSRADLDY